MEKTVEKNKSITEATYEKIKNLLFQNMLQPGFKLQHQDISKLFSVSQTPVREAFNRLLDEGYLELIPNKGYYVREITPKEAEELYDIRMVFELFSIEYGFNKINDAWLKKLETFINEYEREVPKGKFLRDNLNKDKLVHRTLCELSENANMLKIFDRVFEKLILMRITDFALTKKRGQDFADEHRIIFESLQNRNKKAVLKVLKKHIQKGKNNTLKDLEQNPKWRLNPSI